MKYVHRLRILCRNNSIEKARKIRFSYLFRKKETEEKQHGVKYFHRTWTRTLIKQNTFTDLFQTLHLKEPFTILFCFVLLEAQNTICYNQIISFNYIFSILKLYIKIISFIIAAFMICLPVKTLWLQLWHKTTFEMVTLTDAWTIPIFKTVGRWKLW